MTVPTKMSDLSSTIASNSPAGTDTIGTSLDDYIRAAYGIMKQGSSKGSDIASSTTITIPDAGSYFVVTGTTTITGINDSWTGRMVMLKFSGALQLTHGSGFILPGGANITTAAGDVGIFVNESTGVWRGVLWTDATASATEITTTFATVSDMDAYTELTVGTFVKTEGYSAAGDGGGNKYEIVAASTGTDDGGSYIDLSGSGLQAKGLFVDGDISVLQFGVVGDGTTDDSTAMQAAIDYVESLIPLAAATVVDAANIPLYLGGKLIAIGTGLTVDRNLTIHGGSLVALSTFPANSFMLTIQSNAERFSIYDVDFDGGLEELVSGTPSTWKRYADLIENNAPRVIIENVLGIHFPRYGLRLVEAQEVRVLNVTMREWMYTEQGTTYGSLRTAKAFSIEDADGILTNCVGAQSLYPLYLSGALNIVSGCHFYNGGSTDTTEDAAVYIDNTDNTIMNGCYLDNGLIYIKDSFNHKITGCTFQKTSAGTNTAGIYTDTSATNDTVAGLNVTGCSFNGTYTSNEISFGGTGSYVDDVYKKLHWVGNARADGATAWHDLKPGLAPILEYDSAILSSGTDSFYNIKGAKGIRISADYDNNSGSTESKVTIATDGTDRYEFNGSIFQPATDATQWLGSTANRFANIFTNNMSITDGITTPTTRTGYAQIYVDSADGDLKVRFGDGTIKTIVTD